jgi:multiple sugar transport system ATP-binding protein
MAELSLHQVRKAFDGGPTVLHGIDLDIADGEFMVFVGPSGCGKSTLLRLIAGLDDVSGGDIRIGGQSVRDVAAAERGVAMVFQSYALYPHMTVAENMGFALKMSGAPKRDVAKQVARVAEILQISALLDRKPKALSGGQRQRVAIGRAIVRKPKVFLFDEPLSNLDASLRVQMRIELARLHQELRTTMVYVTHDQVEAMTLGTRIAVFNGGKLEQCGAPLDLFERPRNQFVAGFLGSPRMNFIPCEAHALNGSGARLASGSGEITLPRRVQGPCVLGVRPEDLQLAPPGQGLQARIDLVEHLGDLDIAYATLTGTSQAVAVKQLPGAEAPRVGSDVGLVPMPNKAHVFAPDGQAVAA